MEEALQKLKELKLRRHSGEEEDDDLEESDRYATEAQRHRRQNYNDSNDEENHKSGRDGTQYESSYRSTNDRHSLVQQRGEESKQSSDRRITIHDFDFLSTLGTGTFGRVRLVKFKHDVT